MENIGRDSSIWALGSYGDSEGNELYNDNLVPFRFRAGRINFIIIMNIGTSFSGGRPFSEGKFDKLARGIHNIEKGLVILDYKA